MANGRFLATDFIESLPDRDRRRIQGQLVQVTNEGPPGSIQKNRKVSDDIWELKSSQIRLLYFFDGSRRLVLIHGFLKKQQKLPRNELARAQRLRAEYIAGR